MHEEAEPAQVVVDNHDLLPGEWRLYCPRCGYQAEKNTAQSSVCPDCRATLWQAWEPKGKETP